MMKYKIIVGIFGIGLLSSALVVSACVNHTPEEQAEWLTQKATDKLELNQAQQEMFRPLSKKLVQIRTDMKQHKAEKHKELLTMLSQPTLERDKAIRRINKHIDDLQAKTPDLVNSFGDFYDSLTDDQRQALRAELNGHFDHHHSHH
jgi:uncharacterized membrane protein